MAVESPDPRRFDSWEDAFQYPISEVHGFETQLRSHVKENKQKLRSLVGASYRDLLGTANRIISMGEDIEQVEGVLVTAGQRCNSRAVEKLFANYKRYNHTQTERVKDEYALAAELALLQSCTIVLSRLLRSGSSSLVAAKVLVISRLTQKTLSSRTDVPAAVEDQSSRLLSLRKRLLKSIDKKLATSGLDTQQLVEELCAFSLATSSTASDVLRYFLSVRLNAVCSQLRATSLIKDHIVDAMELFVSTLRETDQVFSKRFADALATLKARPLLQQRDVQSISELSLPIHEPWLSGELRNYTPWLRHDELKLVDVQKQLQSWAQNAQEAFLQGVKEALGRDLNINELIKARKAVLKAWPWSSKGRLPGLRHPEEFMDKLRDILNAQLAVVVERTVNSLLRITEAIQKSLHTVQSHQMAAKSLWSNEVLHIDLSDGAENFKRTVLDLHSGNLEPSAGVVVLYDQWTSYLSNIHEAIKKMKETRWDDDDGVADDEEDLDLDDKQALLSEDDPRILQEAMAAALNDAFQKFQEELEAFVDNMDLSSEISPGPTVFLLRVLRDIMKQSRRSPQDVQPRISSRVIQPLHEHLAAHVLRSALPSFQSSLVNKADTPVLIARPLWEGQPPLPIQPSPSAFRLLSRLTKCMATIGLDLWSPAAVRAVKSHLEEGVAAAIAQGLETIRATLHAGAIDVAEEADIEVGEQSQDANQLDNSDASTDADNSHINLKKDISVQLAFDALYIQSATTDGSSVGSRRGALYGTIQQLVNEANLDESARARLEKSAMDYWRRTYLLFGLLA